MPLTRIATELGSDPKTACKPRDADAEPPVTLRRQRSKLAEYAAWIRDRLALRAGVAQFHEM